MNKAQEQSLTYAKNAHNDVFSGNSNHAQTQRFLANQSGSAHFESQIGQKSRKERINFHRRNNNLSAYMHLQIEAIHQDINRMENAARAHEARAKQLGIDIAANEETILKVKDIRQNIAGLDENATYADFLRQTLCDRVFTTEAGNAWDVLQTPLRDADGQAVYSSAKGLYRLKIDPETNEPLISEETCEPVKIYYTDDAIIADLMRKAFNTENPQPFAEYTSKGQDPTNNKFAQLYNILPTNGEIAPTSGAIITILQKPSEKEATIADYEGLCDGIECRAIEENIILEQEKTFEEVMAQKQFDLADQKRQDTIDKYKSLYENGELSQDKREHYEELLKEQAALSPLPVDVEQSSYLTNYNIFSNAAKQTEAQKPSSDFVEPPQSTEPPKLENISPTLAGLLN